MAKQELNLLKLTSMGVAKLGTGARQILRSKALNANPIRAIANCVPDNVFRDTMAPDFAVLTDGAKNSSFWQLSRGDPSVQAL
jgi:hypothetical protein